MNATVTEDMTATLGDTKGNGPEDSSNFMEEVETYMTYRVASYINQYWFPILVPIGLIGNTLSFFVMMRPNNRKVSTCIYMAAISVNDNLMMGLALHNWLVIVVKIHEWELWECKIAAYFVNISLQSSSYQILAMTIDKYVAIKWPHKAATYSTPKRSKIIVLSVFMLALIYNSPHLLVASLVGDQCLTYVVGGTITKIFSWSTFVVNGVIPFSMLIHMNYVIVQTVRRSRKMFRLNATNTDIESSSQGINKGMSTRQGTMKSAENQLTIMLLLVTMLFLILLIPTYIRFIYLTFVERDTPSKYASSMLFFHVTHKLYHSNNGINFFLYCISGRKFRKDLKEILCGTEGSVPFSINAISQKNDSEITTQIKK